MNSDSDELWQELQDMRRRELCNHDFWTTLFVNGIPVVDVCEGCGKRRDAGGE